MFAQLGYYICVPFAWLTRLFYSLTGSYGLALILFTLVVKLVILPFQLKGKKSMLRMNRMQGKMKDIQTRYANNKQRQPLRPGGREPHVRLSVVLPALPHSHRPVRHHPPAPALPHGPQRGHHQRHHRRGHQAGLHRGRGEPGCGL